MHIKFAKGIDVVIENKHIQGLSGVKSNEDDLYLLSMDDGMHYLLDLNDKIIRRYDDFSKISDILKKKMSDYKISNYYRMEMMSDVF